MTPMPIPRAKSGPALALLCALLLVALPTQANAAPSIASPRADAVITGSPVRVVVRAPARRTRVRLGDRDVTARFRVRGGRLVGRLSSRDGLRPGRNRLLIVGSRGGKAVVRQARSFFLVRRSRRLVRVSLSRRAPLRAVIDVGSGRPLGHVLGRERAVRVRLNGRVVTRALSALRGARYSVVLSATHGLRYGVNRLRVFVAEPEQGRYALVKRRIVVRRDRPLAAAGPDRSAEPGVRVRLGGRAKAARGGRLRYRWRLVRRPRGSRARLVTTKASRPRFAPDRPGRYLARLVVSEHRRTRASASQVGAPSVDVVEVVASPQAKLFELSANAFPVDPRGIKVGDNFYAHPGPGATIQFLTLDRATLEPRGTDPNANSWCCDDGAHSLTNLTDALKGSSDEELVVLALPPNRVTLEPGQYADFNAALRLIGVDPLDDALLNDSGQQIVIVGIPYAGEGSGWVRLRGSGSDSFPAQGWLMPDGAATGAGATLFRFTPQRLGFDTSSQQAVPGISNTMNIAGQRVDQCFCDGGAGFQVVEIDSRDLTIVDNRAFPTNFVQPALVEMAAFLDAVRGRGNYVAVQSIGRVGPDFEHDVAWGSMVDALARLGANPQLLNSTHDSSTYAFFGGAQLARDEVAQSSSTIVLDPTQQPPTTEPGRLRGYATMRQDGYFAPLFDGGVASTSSLYDIVFTKPTPWKYTQEAGEPAYAAYEKALQYITLNLPDLKTYKPDLRTAYTALDTYDWSIAYDQVGALKYPGDNESCSDDAGPKKTAPGFTREQFCNQVTELQLEFDWLDDTRQLIADYKAAFDVSAGQQVVDLHKTGETIRTDVEPPADAEVASEVLELFDAFADVAGSFFGVEEAENVAAAIFVVASGYEIGSSVASSKTGMPVDQQVDAKASDLAAEIAGNVANSATALDSIRDVAISDPARLQALANLYTAATSPGGVEVSALAAQLTRGAEGYFASELMPVAYQVIRLLPNYRNPDPQPDNCELFASSNYPYRGIADDGWMHLSRQPNGFESLLLSDERDGPPRTPPASLFETDQVPMFSPYAQNGFGIEKSTWFWAQPITSDNNCNFID